MRRNFLDILLVYSCQLVSGFSVSTKEFVQFGLNRLGVSVFGPGYQ
jgi:hypothetical protein